MRKMYLGVIAIPFILGIFSCKKTSDEPAPLPPTPPPTVPSAIEPPTVYSGYALQWNDEFDGSAIDLSKWVFETGTGVNGDFGTGQLDRATDNPNNASIAANIKNANGNCLAITTRKEAFMDRNYTSARLTTKGNASFGPGTRIEARVWARDVLYKGQGFAFWMMPDEIPAGQTYLMWPQGGEVDIMEYVGAIPNHNLASVHYAWFWENNQYQDWNHGHMGAYYSYEDKQVPLSNPGYGGWPPSSVDQNTGSAGFHLYRIDWYNNRMEFSIDEQVYHIHYFNDGGAFSEAPDGKDKSNTILINNKRTFVSEYSNHFPEWNPFVHKFFLLLTAGVGGSDTRTYGGAIAPSAGFPCSVFVDWVRVYKRN